MARFVMTTILFFLLSVVAATHAQDHRDKPLRLRHSSSGDRAKNPRARASKSRSHAAKAARNGISKLKSFMGGKSKQDSHHRTTRKQRLPVVHSIDKDTAKAAAKAATKATNGH
mmetsp:Transcript_180/g.482  ORF Transcript_180/g.482 Transcript_180/m.482 type:complete len:114 (-) Transcript_180:290-631(-)|eukprot:CAMPEP_0197395178 /NCGR_PEP_ID=MMETSP1165-20131217/6398_1 /TAXON_ID=284809 /ORGANISM="Chrysocystis fragilis, Strain CCMP3189" /LENGTH=113 /DNA_ID=CAMNT_0042920929 /DNA_START=65 /DNA_END=406 /DNA_ORIENTATION=-